MKRKAIFAGSFDPFTKGHEDIVLRGLRMFDEIVIAVGVNTQKKRYFELEMMLSKIKSTFEKHPNVSIESYEMLTSEFARLKGAKFLLRGLRNTTDLEYENAIANTNKYLNPELETIFLITSPELAPISSTIIREMHKYGANPSHFLPYDL
ncbi:MAG: pantetheine-phosphate adenylyltransferase [Bacteroidota bacterium]|nr:pantetheine-phosphate adenylyltransferase [Bacteroidota bacterium]